MIPSGFKILDASVDDDYENWISQWEKWPSSEVFAHPEYVKLFCREGDRALCAAWISTQGGILFPLIKRPLERERWTERTSRLSDLIGPYGYSGPYCWGQVNARDFWDSFNDWALKSDIISLFTRLSVFQDQILPFCGVVEVNAPNIVRTLDARIEEIWMCYEHKVRKNVKRAEAEGVTVEQDNSGTRLDEFLSVYSSTMLRRNADKRYFFPRKFFSDLVQNLAGQYIFFNAVRNGQIISSELVLVSARHIYSFLGGTLSEAFIFRPNDLIKHRIIQWGITVGKAAFVLGGGLGGPDSIYRYKRSFAPDGVRSFCVGKHILDESLYAEMVNIRMRYEKRTGNPWTPRPGFFPAYRG